MNFDKALEKVLQHEGGYVDHPQDPGGATNLGCTKVVWEEWIGHPCTVDDIKALTPEDVGPLYRKKYWDTVKADDLPVGLNYCVFDTAINSGPGRAVKFLQEVVGSTPDGLIGPKTLAALRDLNPKDAINAYCDKRLAFLQELKTWEVFGKGWGRRVEDVRQSALEMLDAS